MALTNMKLFDRFVAEATIETLAQMVDKFNAASAGAIVLTTQGFNGSYINEQMWKSIHSAQRRVNRFAANTTASPTALQELREAGVKVAGGFGPVTWEPGQLTWMQKNPAEAVEMASRNMAEAIMRDQLNSAIAALCAALSNTSGVRVEKTTGSNASKVTYAMLNAAHAKFGDMSGAIVANVMDGATYHALIGQNLANSNRLFQANGVTVVDILGKAVIVTDAPALSVAAVTVAPTAPAKSRVLGLVANAATVYDGSDLITNTQVSNGAQRITATFQADYTFGLAIKGYTWDTSNGGRSPSDAAIATGSNWDKVATSNKHTAGVIATGLAS